MGQTTYQLVQDVFHQQYVLPITLPETNMFTPWKIGGWETISGFPFGEGFR